MGMLMSKGQGKQAYPLGLPDTNTTVLSSLCKRKGLTVNKICTVSLGFSRSRDERNDANLPALTTRAFLAVSYKIIGRADSVMYLAVCLREGDKS